MDLTDFALLLLRLWIGFVMIMHGFNHATSLEGTARWFDSVGFRSAKLNARLSAYAELAIGAGIAVGFLTSFALAGMVATVFVAFWAIHRFAGFFVFYRPDEGYEYVATLAIAGLVLAILGPGAASVDDAVGIAGSLDGAVGALIVLGGLAAGAAQAAVFWRKPEAKTDDSQGEA